MLDNKNKMVKAYEFFKELREERIENLYIKYRSDIVQYGERTDKKLRYIYIMRNIILIMGRNIFDWKKTKRTILIDLKDILKKYQISNEKRI